MGREIRNKIMIGLNQDLIVILAIAAFIFGAKRLPEIGKGLGKGIQEFKNGLNNQEEKKFTGEGGNASNSQSINIRRNEDR
jgi:sec-independent protein translocase protein TatA